MMEKIKKYLVSHFLHLKKYLISNIYAIWRPILLSKIRRKTKKKVVFFCINLGMWKCDELFELLLKSKDFDPYVVSFLYPEDSIDYQKMVQESMAEYFAIKGFPFIEMYDFKDRKWFDISTFSPDLIFYAQPYNIGYKQYLFESLLKLSLFAYIPYGFDIEDNPIFYNTTYLNICTKLYYPTHFHKKYEGEMLYNKGKNIVVSGNPIVEKISGAEVDFTSIWKKHDEHLKRIIWAPHHSILESDTLHYSNFLQIADDMLMLAKKYQDMVQFAFKPHPRLRVKLYACEGWGKEKTDNYYKEWSSLSNSVFVEGEYIGLFSSSDALIHDCSTFTAEYLATGHPVMFVSKNSVNYSLNQFGQDCFDLHYKGETIENVENFINKVVIEGNDFLFHARKKFRTEVLLGITGKTYAEIILNDLESTFVCKQK